MVFVVVGIAFSTVLRKKLEQNVEAFAQLGLPEGALVTVAQAEPPESMGALRRKLAGERLRSQEFLGIVRDIAERHYSKIELTAFVVATHHNELDREEVYFLTDAMTKVGRRLDWHERPVVDKQVVDKERIGLNKQADTEDREVSADVAREEVEVEESGTDGRNRDA